LEKIADRDFSNTERNNVAECVAIGAIKYSILHQAIGNNIIFDFDKSLSFEGDSGPYLQYSYARAKSILRKTKKGNVPKNTSAREVSVLEKMLYQFPEIVARAGSEYAPHYIATYLIEVASAFNSFYAHNKIIDIEDANSPYKIALTQAFSIVLKNGLNLLGIETVEKM
jgi:arginyl-tRNA synthetase